MNNTIDKLSSARFDVFLLRCLDALLSESHVTRAAFRVGVTQPTMSAALGRLRRLFDDPLLVRTNRGMVLSPRAVSIRPKVREALELIHSSLNTDRSFMPTSDHASLRVGASESVLYVLFPPLVNLLSTEAPHFRLLVDSPRAASLRQDLEEGRVDLTIAYIDGAASDLRTSHLYRQPLKVIASAHHPTIRGELTLAQYMENRHACYAVGDDLATLERNIDTVLAREGLRRQVAAVVPSITALPGIVGSSDLFSTVPMAVAHGFAVSSNLQVLDPPVAFEPVQISMYWHERMHHVGVHEWLRNKVRQAARQVVRSDPGASCTY